MKQIYPIRLSGQQHKAWRQQIANQASSVNGKGIQAGNKTFTVKYPLDLKGVTLPNTDELVTLYNTINGKGPGSLYHFLMAVHLSGFDLYGSVNEAQLALNAETLKPQPVTMANRHGELVVEELDVKALFKVLNRTKPPEYEPLLFLLYNAMSTTERVRAGIDCQYPGLFKAISQALHWLFDTRHPTSSLDMKASLPDFLVQLDKMLVANGVSLTSLASLHEKIVPLNYKAPMLYHGNVTRMSTEPGHLIYQVIASKTSRDPTLLQDKLSATGLKTAISSSNGDALCWLFNKGIALMRDKNALKAAYPEISSMALQQLVAAARFLPTQTIFGTAKYQDFRNTVQEGLDSWISTFAKRLLQIKAQLATDYSLTPELGCPEYADAFTGTSYTYDSCLALMKRVLAQKKSVVDQVEMLTGLVTRGALLPDTFIEFIQIHNAVVNVLKRLKNNLSAELRMAKKARMLERAEQLDALQSDMVVPEKIFQLPRIGGGVIQDADTEMHHILSRYQSLLGILKGIETQICCDEQQAIKSGAMHLKKQHQRRGNNPPESALKDSAKRRLLQPLFKAIRNFSGQRTRHLAMENVRALALFKSNRRHLNLFFEARKGYIFHSPYASTQHEQYPFDRDVFESLALTTWADALFAQLADIPDHSAMEMKDLVLFRRVRAELKIRCASKCPTIPIEKLEPLGILIPADLRQAHSSELLNTEQLTRIVNLISSGLLECVNRLLRPDFKLKMSFRRKSTSKVVYGVKPGSQFAMHPKLIAGKSTLSAHLKALGFDTRRVDVARTIHSGCMLSKKTALVDSGINKALAALPHDFYVPLNFAGAPDKKGCFFTLSNGAMSTLHDSCINAARIVGTASMKKWLHRYLESGDIRLGDYDLLFEPQFTATCTIRQGEIQSVTTQPAELRVSLAVPFTVNDYQPMSTLSFADMALGIDLNQRGIGYAAVSVKSGTQGEIIDSGTVTVPAIKHLLDNLSRSDKRFQKEQTFDQTTNDYTPMRRSVVGDICHVIDSLMSHYQAFPVFEAAAKRLDADTYQLRLLYDAVKSRYTYSEIQAHKARKAHYWQGGQLWQHPFLQVPEYNNQRKVIEGKTKPLLLHPGVEVSAAGTSQTCSECGVDPFYLVSKTLPDDGTVHTNHSGEFTIEGITLFLKKRDQDLVKCERRKNRRAQAVVPLANMVLEKPALLSAMARFTRTPPTDRRSKDSSRSQFQCLNVNCQARLHADENAGKNIAMRLLRKTGLLPPR